MTWAHLSWVAASGPCRVARAACLIKRVRCHEGPRVGLRRVGRAGWRELPALSGNAARPSAAAAASGRRAAMPRAARQGGESCPPRGALLGGESCQRGEPQRRAKCPARFYFPPDFGPSALLAVRCCSPPFSQPDRKWPARFCFPPKFAPPDFASRAAAAIAIIIISMTFLVFVLRHPRNADL